MTKNKKFDVKKGKFLARSSGKKSKKIVKTFTIKHKQTPIVEYTYKKNGAKITICAVEPPYKFVDSLLFHLRPAKSKPIAFYLRPDEAMLMAKMLIDAVYRTTKNYEFGLLKGSVRKDPTKVNKPLS